MFKNHMKKLSLALVSLILLILISSCSSDIQQIERAQSELGVYDGQYITFYDRDLNTLGKQRFQLTDNTVIADWSQAKSNKVYTLSNRSDKSDYILEIDFITGKRKKWNLGTQCYGDMAVDGKSVYTGASYVGNLIIRGTIERKKSPDQWSTDAQHFSVVSLKQFQQKPGLLFAFGDLETDFREQGKAAAILNIDATSGNVMETVYPLGYGWFPSAGSKAGAIVIGDNLYTSMLHGTYADGSTGAVLVRYNFVTKETEQIDVGHEGIFNLFQFNSNQILAIHGKGNNEITGATVIDIYTNQIRSFSFDHELLQYQAFENQLYITDEKNIYHYEYDEIEGFRLEKKVQAFNEYPQSKLSPSLFLTNGTGSPTS